MTTATKKTHKRNPVRQGVTLSAFLYAISKRESGNYGAVNPDSGALGKYQVLPSNVPSWSQECLGYSITPEQFLTSPRLQERIVRCKLGNYFRKYGPAGAAAAWYSGDPSRWNDPTPVGGIYPSVKSYVGDVLGIAARAMHLKPSQLQPHPPATGGGSGQVENVVSVGGIAKGIGGALTDPFGWIAGKTIGPVIVSVEKLVTQSLIVLVGVGVIVVGAYEAFKREDDNSSGGGGMQPPPIIPAGGKGAAGAAGAPGAELALAAV